VESVVIVNAKPAWWLVVLPASTGLLGAGLGAWWQGRVSRDHWRRDARIEAYSELLARHHAFEIALTEVAIKPTGMSNEVALGGTITGGATATTAFTLPLSFRPVQRVNPSILQTSTGVNGAADVLMSGTVSISGAGVDAPWTSLDGIRFFVA
jgi:hypothetical protein